MAVLHCTGGPPPLMVNSGLSSGLEWRLKTGPTKTEREYCPGGNNPDAWGGRGRWLYFPLKLWHSAERSRKGERKVWVSCQDATWALTVKGGGSCCICPWRNFNQEKLSKTRLGEPISGWLGCRFGAQEAKIQALLWTWWALVASPSAS